MISVIHILEQHYKTKSYEDNRVLPIPDSVFSVDHLQRSEADQEILRQSQRHPSYSWNIPAEKINHIEDTSGILADSHSEPRSRDGA